MRVLLLSWEYPPRIVGGLGRHVYRLSLALAEAGHQVHVVTRDHPDAPSEEIRDGVHILRVSEYAPMIPFEDLIPWVLQFNLGLVEKAVGLLHDVDVDVIHAHDWLVSYAAANCKNLFDVPLVSTIHATEYGRHQGHLPEPMNKLIHQVEWWLTYESRRTITCSQYMRDQVRDIFQLPPTKLDVIPNGVDLEAFEVKSDLAAFRASVIPDGHKLVFFAGRLEYEKGVQTVLEALPALIKEMPVQFHIAGSGTHREELEKLTTRLELGEHVRFLGFLNESELANYYRAADLAVVPSLYEPFGMVALETMAAGTPLIVGDTGGLRELVSHGATGLRVAPGDPEAMLDALRRVLTDHRLARRIAMDARRRLTTEYSWASIARSTVNVYERAMAEEKFLRSTIREERVPLRVILGRSPLLAARSS